jgi:hypothetical protein
MIHGIKGKGNPQRTGLKGGSIVFVHETEEFNVFGFKEPN